MTARATGPFRYLPWFARDVLRFPGTLFVVLSLVIGYIDWRLAVRFGMTSRLPGRSFVDALQAQTWNASLTIAVLLAVGGVIGVDLQRGYYRSLFTKPMAPWWYYLQRYLAGAVAVLLTPLLFGLVLELTMHTGLGLDGRLFATVALGYLLTGGACLLLGNFRAEAWLLVFLMVVAQSIMGGLLENMERFRADPPLVLLWLHRLLPPFDRITLVGPPIPRGDLWHIIIYGAAMLLAALLLLRYRPLGRGGRS